MLLRKILDWRNVAPLLLCPLCVWGTDLLLHLLPIGAAGILVLSIVLPVVAFLFIWWSYKTLVPSVPPELPAAIGLLYSQPLYLLALKAAVDGFDKVDPTGFTAMIVSVPLSNLIISTFDGTLVALPLILLAMVLAGIAARKRRALGST